MSDPTVEELQQQLAELSSRVAALETQVVALRNGEEIPEEDLVAIGAAVAAFFGHKARVRAVRFGRQASWVAATRERVHDRRVPHIR